MKRKALLAIVLPAILTVSLVSTGFAIWTFNNNQTVDNITGTVDVAKTFAGTLAKTSDTSDTFKIHLDQSTVASNLGDNDLNHGISFTKESGTDPLTEIKATYSLTENDITALKDGNLKVTLKAEFTFSTALLAYVEVKDDGFTNHTSNPASIDDFVLVSNTNNDGKYTLTKEIDKTTLTSITSGSKAWTFGVSTATTSDVNALLKYKSGQKPTDAAGVSAMTTALQSCSPLSVSFSATVSQVVGA